jgi:hypothetical protein
MKSLRIGTLALGVALLALLLAGANSPAVDRPAGIEANRWIRISESAGLVLTNAQNPRQPLVGQLFVRTDSGWHVVAIHSPATVELLRAGG